MTSILFNHVDLQEFLDTMKQVGDKHFYFVGDEGVYFCTDSTNPNSPDENSRFVVYAENCNPELMEFDEWWAIKNATWGGDDGGETLPLEDLEEWVRHLDEYKAETEEEYIFQGNFYLTVDMTPDSISMNFARKGRGRRREN